MAYLEWLEKTLAEAIARGSIGAPVALRAFLQLTADHGLLSAVAAQSAEAAGRWFQSPVTRVYAQGGPAAGYLSVLTEYAAGQMALVVCETLRQEEPSATLVVVGNRGTLRWDDIPDAPAGEPAASPLRAAIERSLRSGQSEEARRG